MYVQYKGHIPYRGMKLNIKVAEINCRRLWHSELCCILPPLGDNLHELRHVIVDTPDRLGYHLPVDYVPHVLRGTVIVGGYVFRRAGQGYVTEKHTAQTLGLAESESPAVNLVLQEIEKF